MNTVVSSSTDDRELTVLPPATPVATLPEYPTPILIENMLTPAANVGTQDDHIGDLHEASDAGADAADSLPPYTRQA